MNAVQQIGTGRAQALPLSLIAQAIPKLSRHDLEALTERLIDRLDEVDGDPDREEDDPSGLCDEDGINTDTGLHYQHCHKGPGCELSDPGGMEP